MSKVKWNNDRFYLLLLLTLLLFLEDIDFDQLLESPGQLANIAVLFVDSWRPLGRSLGFQEEELNAIDKAHPTYHASERSYQVLYQWTRRTEIHTLKALLECVRSCSFPPGETARLTRQITCVIASSKEQ